jgi:hypothetical protein
MPISPRTWQEALDSQSACNLSGLAHFLVRALDELRASGIASTDDLNTHSIVRLAVAQMAHLGFGSFDCGAGELWRLAYHVAEDEAQGSLVP